MTISAEELIVLLFVLHTGKPLLVRVKRRFLKAITASAQRKLLNRGHGIRLRARVIDIWID